MIHNNDAFIKHKVGLLNLVEYLGNVSKAWQVLGLSRDTFYRYEQALEDGGIELMLNKDRRIGLWSLFIDRYSAWKTPVDQRADRPSFSGLKRTLREFCR